MPKDLPAQREPSPKSGARDEHSNHLADIAHSLARSKRASSHALGGAILLILAVGELARRLNPFDWLRELLQ